MTAVASDTSSEVPVTVPINGTPIDKENDNESPSDTINSNDPLRNASREESMQVANKVEQHRVADGDEHTRDLERNTDRDEQARDPERYTKRDERQNVVDGDRQSRDADTDGDERMVDDQVAHADQKSDEVRDVSSDTKLEESGNVQQSQQNWIRKFSKEAPDLSDLDKYYPNMPAHFRKSVIVNNISPKLTIHQLKTFFSFCGKIERIGLSNGNFIGYSVLNATDVFAEDSPLNESKAEIHYFTEHAANTACLLDQTQLLGSYLKITKKSERQLHPLSELTGDEPLRDDVMEDVDDGGLGKGSIGGVHGDEPPIDFSTFMSLIKEHDSNVRRVKYTDYSNSQAESLHFSLYIGNLHGMITEEEFVSIMRNCGPIVNYQLAGDPTHPTRFGFVQYMHREDRELALKLLNGLNFMGYALKVNACNKPISVPHIMVSKDELRNFSNATLKLQEKIKTFYRSHDRARSPLGRNLSPPPHHGSSSRRSPPPSSSGRRSPGPPNRESQTSYSYPYRPDQGSLNPMGGRAHGDRSDRWHPTSSGYSSYNTPHNPSHSSHGGHQPNPPNHSYRSGSQGYNHGRPNDTSSGGISRRGEVRDRHSRDGNSDDYDSDKYRRGEKYEGGSRRRLEGYDTNHRGRGDYRDQQGQQGRSPYNSRQHGPEHDRRYRDTSQHSEARSLPQKRKERGEHDHDAKRPRP